MRGAGKLSWTDVLRLSSWEMAKFAPFFVIGFFLFSIFLPNFTFTKVSKYHGSGLLFTNSELQKLKENDEPLFKRLDINGNGKIDGINIRHIDVDSDGSLSDDELKTLQKDDAALKSADENNDGKIDAKEKTRAEEYLKEINKADGYLGWDSVIYFWVLLSFFLILFGISAKYAYSYRVLRNRDAFLDKFPKFIGLKPISLYVVGAGFAASIVIFYHASKIGEGFSHLHVLFILVFATTILFIVAFLKGLKAETFLPGKPPRPKPDAIIDADIRNLSWQLPSIPSEKYGGKQMQVSYEVSRHRNELYIDENKINFRRNNNKQPPKNKWPEIYISNDKSLETMDLATNLYRLVEQYRLSEYQQVELFLTAVTSITKEKSDLLAPKMNFLVTDKVEAVEYPAEKKLSALAYLYVRVAGSSSDDDEFHGFSDDGMKLIDRYLREWYDKLRTKDEVEFPPSDLEKFVDQAIEYVKAEIAGEGGEDADEMFYIPAIEAFTPDEHYKIIPQMERGAETIKEAEELEEDDERSERMKKFIEYVHKRFNDYHEEVGDIETLRPKEYSRYPTETLYGEAGDAEDTAVLLAALLRECRFDVQLLELESGETEQDKRMACGVRIEGFDSFDEYQDKSLRGYIYCEPTHNKNRVIMGKIPSGLRLINRYDVKPIPAPRIRSKKR